MSFNVFFQNVFLRPLEDTFDDLNSAFNLEISVLNTVGVHLTVDLKQIGVNIHIG
jgi:hypothetical protein|tara:strand:+ start:9051 stop:9215 length:165 start_codon:yes stop_codon:yes gene_type:complete